MAADLDKIAQIQDVIQKSAGFAPTEEQFMAKARFWRRVAANPLQSETVQALLPSDIATTAGDPRVERWWSNVKFQQWFLDKDFVENGFRALAEMAISVLSDMLRDTAMDAKARVQVMKLIFEHSEYRPASKKEVKWADQEIGALTPEEVDNKILELAREAGFTKSS